MNRHIVEIRFDRCRRTEDKPWAVQERYNGRLVKQVEVETKAEAITYGESMARTYGAAFVGYLHDRS
jgi:hypothetical protein